MKLNDMICASEDVVSREVNGEMVLLDLASGTYFGLNKVGSRIWELLDVEVHSIGQLCDTIEAEFDALRPDIERDVFELLNELDAQKLIVPSPG